MTSNWSGRRTVAAILGITAVGFAVGMFLLFYLWMVLRLLGFAVVLRDGGGGGAGDGQQKGCGKGADHGSWSCAWLVEGEGASHRVVVGLFGSEAFAELRPGLAPHAGGGSGFKGDRRVAGGIHEEVAFERELPL